MTFGRQKPQELQVPAAAAEVKNSADLLRAWIVDAEWDGAADPGATSVAG